VEVASSVSAPLGRAPGHVQKVCQPVLRVAEIVVGRARARLDRLEALTTAGARDPGGHLRLSVGAQAALPKVGQLGPIAAQYLNVGPWRRRRR